MTITHAERQWLTLVRLLAERDCDPRSPMMRDAQRPNFIADLNTAALRAYGRELHRSKDAKMTEQITHKPTNVTCLVAHYDADRRLLPGCILCARCRNWIRPEHMGQACIQPPKP